MELLDWLRLLRAAERLCSLPPRVVYELLAKVGRSHVIEDDALVRVKRLAGLDPQIFRVLGGNIARSLPALLDVFSLRTLWATKAYTTRTSTVQIASRYRNRCQRLATI